MATNGRHQSSVANYCLRMTFWTKLALSWLDGILTWVLVTYYSVLNPLWLLFIGKLMGLLLLFNDILKLLYWPFLFWQHCITEREIYE